MAEAKHMRREFRANLAVRLAVLAALAVWVAGAVVSAWSGLPGYALASSLFFVAFFLVFAAYYWSMVYIVDEYGVTYRGATDFEHFEWDEIVQLKSSDIPLGGYYLTTRSGGSLVLSGFVHHHRELAETIARRAGLVPLPS